LKRSREGGEIDSRRLMADRRQALAELIATVPSELIATVPGGESC
jgi:hypothetical protein